jgi:hypothetical protein
LWQDDRYFGDGPVALDFDGEQLEICHQKFIDVSITWNTLFPENELSSDRFPGMTLKKDGMPSMRRFLGRRLAGVDLLEWDLRDGGESDVAIHLDFGDEGIIVYNHTDSTQFKFGDLNPAYLRFPL